MISGRRFLQIPGPTNVPDRILRAMDRPVIDHRSPEFAELTMELLPMLRPLFGTREAAIVVYPASGTGAWEAALTNALGHGDRVLAYNYGQFSAGFAEAARNLGFTVDEVSLRWGQAVPPADLMARLESDRKDPYRAVLVVHSETSTGVITDIGAVRAAMDSAGHDALLIVDAVSSIGSMPFQFDDWRVDVSATCSQKGLMLPPGLAVLCVGPRALAAAERGGSPRNFFDWRPILRDNRTGFFPYTPATLMLYGLRESLRMLLDEEGLEQVFARHRQLASGVRAAVRAWGLAMVAEDPDTASDSLTAVMTPEGLDATNVIVSARDTFGLSLGVGLGPLRTRAFRIGHLGALNELEVLGTIAGVELTLAELCDPEIVGRGIEACERVFLDRAREGMGAGAATEMTGSPA